MDCADGDSNKKWLDNDILEMRNSLRDVQQSLDEIKTTMANKPDITVTCENEVKGSETTSAPKVEIKAKITKKKSKGVVKQPSGDKIAVGVRRGPTRKGGNEANEKTDGEWGKTSSLAHYESLGKEEPKSNRVKLPYDSHNVSKARKATFKPSSKEWHHILEEKRHRGHKKLPLPIVNIHGDEQQGAELLPPGSSLPTSFSRFLSNDMFVRLPPQHDLNDPLSKSFTAAKDYLKQILDEEESGMIDFKRGKHSSYVKKEKIRQYLMSQQKPQYRLRKRSPNDSTPENSPRGKDGREEDMRSLVTEELAVTVTFDPDVKEVFRTQTKSGKQRSKLNLRWDTKDIPSCNCRAQEKSKLEELLDIRPDPLAGNKRLEKLNSSDTGHQQKTPVDGELTGRGYTTSRDRQQKPSINQSRSKYSPTTSGKSSPDKMRTHQVILPEILPSRSGTPDSKILNRTTSQAARRTFYRGSFANSFCKEKVEEAGPRFDPGTEHVGSRAVDAKSPTGQSKTNSLQS